MTVLFGSSLWWLVKPVGCLAKLERAIAGRTTTIVRVAAPTAMVSGVGWLVCSLADMTGTIGSVFDPDTLSLFFFDTPFGPVLMLRIVLLTILLLVAFAPLSDRARFTCATLLAGLLLISQAWLGHAAQGGPGLSGAAMMLVYDVHVLAAGAWAGALPALIVCVVMRSDKGEIPDLLRRYSAIATVAVVAIVATGIANTLFRTGARFAALAASPYGTVLLVKLGFVAGMLACAAWHRFVAMPRLRDGKAGASELASLRASLSLELALATFVLGMAALLGVTPPPA